MQELVYFIFILLCNSQVGMVIVLQNIGGSWGDSKFVIWKIDVEYKNSSILNEKLQRKNKWQWCNNLGRFIQDQGTTFRIVSFLWFLHATIRMLRNVGCNVNTAKHIYFCSVEKAVVYWQKTGVRVCNQHKQVTIRLLM